MTVSDAHKPCFLRAERLAAWYKYHYGRCISAQLCKIIESQLLRLPIQSVLQLGIHFEEQEVGMTTHSGLPVSLRVHGNNHGVFLSSSECLPIKNDILDCVVIMHGLNIEQNPHRLLREADRVLADDGYLIIVGFNPYSLLGCLKPLGKLLGQSPWDCRFHSISKLKDWLGLLDFDVHHVDTLSYCAPFWSERFSQRFQAYKKLTVLKGRSFGNIYCIIARKRTVCMTRIPQFKQKRFLKFTSPGLRPTIRLKTENLIVD